MKLNPDCIRDLLIEIEQTCTVYERFDSIHHIENLTSKYSKDELAYHARQCSFAGLVCDYKTYISGDWMIGDLTPKGHEFLANIQEDTIWNNVKAISAKVGSKSISALSQIASSVITEIIKSQFGLR